MAHFIITHTNIFLVTSARPKLASAATHIHQLRLAGFAAPLTHLFVQQEPQDSGVPSCAACVRLSVAPGHLFLTILFTWISPLMQLHAFPKLNASFKTPPFRPWHRAVLEASQLNQEIPSRGGRMSPVAVKQRPCWERKARKQQGLHWDGRRLWQVAQSG